MMTIRRTRPPQHGTLTLALVLYSTEYSGALQSSAIPLLTELTDE